MSTEGAVSTKLVPRNRLLLRGESAVAFIGIALAAILVCAIAGSAWWAMRTQQQAYRTAAAEQSRSVGRLLASTAEAMMAGDDLSSLRRLVAETSRHRALTHCRIELPDGSIIADADPSRITAQRLPATWSGAGVVGDAEVIETINPTQIDLTYPLSVPGRGAAKLHMGVPVVQPAGLMWQVQMGMGAIAAISLIAALLVYRHSRDRMCAIGAIREALIAIEGGEKSSAALAVSADLGHEAQAWNQLLLETEKLRKATALERARESVGERRHSKSDLDSVCDAMPQGLIVVDDQMRAKYANGAAAVFLQAPREKLVGADLTLLVHDDQVRDLLKGWRNGEARRRATLETTRQGEQGPGGVLRWTIRPVRREDSGTAMIAIEDITQQRVADEARHQFVAQATHELRTPLTNIRLYVETALDEGENDAVLRAKCLNVINSESRRLERIVNDLLSTAEIEAGSLQITKDDVRMSEIFTELQADYEAHAAEKQVDLKFNLPPKLPVIQGDREMIVLALHNLIGNAMKYTPNGGRVSVNVDVDRDKLVVDVVDSGIGISEEDQQHVFEKFYRAKDRRLKDITGSGLGLALAREVMRLHGGDITVESQLDVGSTFTLTLPGADAA